MIDRLMSLYDQYYAYVMTLYQTADLLTQYVIIIVSGVALFLLSMIMVLSKMTK